MTIENILNGEKLHTLQVDVIKKVNEDQFIVADVSGVAIINVVLDRYHKKHVAVGKSLKIVKPFKIDGKVISWNPKFCPIMMKSMKIVVDDDELKELESSVNQSVQTNMQDRL